MESTLATSGKMWKQTKLKRVKLFPKQELQMLKSTNEITKPQNSQSEFQVETFNQKESLNVLADNHTDTNKKFEALFNS